MSANNIVLTILLIFPFAVVFSALVNMGAWKTFSWSELILDYAVGVLCGICLCYGTEPDAGFVSKLVLIMSTGLFGVLHLAEVGFVKGPTDLLMVVVVATVVATLVTALLDHAALAIGKEMSAAGGAFSALLWLIKAPFWLLTTAVGMLFFLVGIVRSFIGTGGRVGFLAGVFYVEWNKDDPSASATTLGATVQVWTGKMADLIDHELYHSRQYIYLKDWLTPTWLVGGIWGLISGAAAGKTVTFQYFTTASKTKELGNPLERAAYRISGGSFLT